MQNEKKRLLLVHPKVAKAGEFYAFPFGMAYVSAYLKHLGVSVSVLDLCHSDIAVTEQMRDHLAATRADVVCTGGMSLLYPAIQEVVQAVRAINPDATVVVGGPMVTADPPLSAKVLGYDYGIIGDAKLTMAELLAVWHGERDLATVNGLIFKRGERYETTAPHAPIMDLHSLPFPDFEGFAYERHLSMIRSDFVSNTYKVLDHPRPAGIIGSRSCPYGSTFCYPPLGHICRQRSLENIKAEIDHLAKRHNLNMLLVLDELFSTGRKRMHTSDAMDQRLDFDRRHPCQFTARLRHQALAPGTKANRDTGGPDLR